MFRAFSRPSSGAQWLQWQPLGLPSYRGDSRVVSVVGPAGRPAGPTTDTSPPSNAVVKKGQTLSVFLRLCLSQTFCLSQTSQTFSNFLSQTFCLSQTILSTVFLRLFFLLFFLSFSDYSFCLSQTFSDYSFYCLSQTILSSILSVFLRLFFLSFSDYSFYSPYGPYGLYRASVPVQGCTLPYSRAIPLLPLWAVWPVQSLSASTRMHFTYLFVFLSCYGAHIGRRLPKFRDSQSVPSSLTTDVGTDNVPTYR